MNGEVLAGRYRLLALLGRGGAGEVWRAEDTFLAREVAVKLLRSLEGDPMDAVQRFRAEAQSAARLTHPNVVATYDVGTEGDHVFLVMELVQGPDLAKLMRTSGLPSPELVARIASQGARALDAAHAAGIVHRDVKPGNLLMAPDGTLKMTDFGIAKRAGNETTGLGVLLGTASYVSPEQVRGEAATPASDWYSFGCVLHELLTGTPPFSGPTVDVVMRQHLDAPPPQITRPDVPAELANLVTRLLAKNPADRPSSAEQVAALLSTPANTQVLAMEPLGVGHWEEDDEPTSHRAPARAFPLAKVGIGVAVVLAAIAGFLLLRQSVSNDTPTARAESTPSAPAQKATAAPKPTPNCGFAPAEGGAVLVVEEEGAARGRGADVRATVAGHAATFTGPGRWAESREGLARAIEGALAEAGCRPEEVDVVFADALGVPEADRAEALALADALGPHAARVPVTAPKTGTGRAYCAAPVLDVATAVLAMEHGLIPPTPHVFDVCHDLDLVTGRARPAEPRTALVLARGLMGSNSALVLRRGAVPAEGR